MADTGDLSERPPLLVPDATAALAREEDAEIVRLLESYRAEAKSARWGGDNPRDDKWRENVDLYWNRFDFSKKAEWQAKETMPEVPEYVDRFAAAMKMSLMQSDDFFSMDFPGDLADDLARTLKKLMDVILSRCGTGAMGHPISFPAVFEDLMKLGAMMQVCAAVRWKDDGKDGWVYVEPIDPRMVWIDATGRGLYRVLRMEIDRNELMRFKDFTDGNGDPIYDLAEIDYVAAAYDEWEKQERQKLSGTDSNNQTSVRKPIILDEYLATIVDNDGEVLGENVVAVIANERNLIRRPEPNPYWHKQDWILASPIVTVPLSPYGRSYMENFGSLARTFNDLTNLILDAVQTSAIKAFAANVDQLEDSAQLDEGIAPNVLFRLSSGAARDFLAEIDLGALPQDVMIVWKALDDKLRQAAAFNELALGQLAPNSRTSATEVSSVQGNSGAFMGALAATIETRIIEPLLNLVWMTFLQHMPRPGSSPALEAAAGPEIYAAIYARRKEFVKSPVTFRARGISAMVAKSLKFRNLMQVLSIIAQSQPLLAQFMQNADLAKLMNVLFKLNDIDPTEFQLSPRDKMMQQIQAQSQQNAGAAGPGGPTPNGGNTGMPGGGPADMTNAAVAAGMPAGAPTVRT